MAEITETEPIKVQDRVFHPATRTTFAQDMYVMKLATESKIENLSSVSDVDLNDLAKRILLDAYESGTLFKMIAGMVVEDGVKWSRETAEENATFFENLTEPEDKEALHEAMAGVILSFFVNAGGFLQTSPKSSSVTVHPREPRSESPPNLSSDESNVELSTSEFGTQ